MMANAQEPTTSFGISPTWEMILWANAGKETTSNVVMRRIGGP